MNDLDGSLNRINVVLNRPNPFKSLKPDVESVYDWFESGWNDLETVTVVKENAVQRG